MFSHFNLEFDLQKKQITAETAAKDFHGVPHYQFIYDTADQSSIEISNIGDWGTKEALVNVPAAQESAVMTKNPSIDLEMGDRLTMEE